MIKKLLFLTFIVIPLSIYPNETNSSKLNFHIYPEFNIGAMNTTNFNKWEKDQSYSYLSYLNANNSNNQSYHFNNSSSASNTFANVGIGIAFDLFYNNFGVGFSISGNINQLGSEVPYGWRIIKDESNQNQYAIDYQLLSRNISYSLFYRHYLFTLWESDIDIRLGFGLNYVTLYYYYGISDYNDYEKDAPYESQFSKNFHGSGIGYHISTSLVADVKYFTIVLGLNWTKAAINSFTDDSNNNITNSNSTNFKTKVNIITLNFGLGFNL